MCVDSYLKRKTGANNRHSSWWVTVMPTHLGWGGAGYFQGLRNSPRGCWAHSGGGDRAAGAPVKPYHFAVSEKVPTKRWRQSPSQTGLFLGGQEGRGTGRERRRCWVLRRALESGLLLRAPAWPDLRPGLAGVWAGSGLGGLVVAGRRPPVSTDLIAKAPGEEGTGQQCIGGASWGDPAGGGQPRVLGAGSLQGVR